MHIGFLSFGIVVWCCVVCVVFSYIYNYIVLQFFYLYRYNHVYICMLIVIRVKKQPLFANYFVVWRSSVFFSFLFSNNTHTHSNVLILVLQHMALIITNECYYIFFIIYILTLSFQFSFHLLDDACLCVMMEFPFIFPHTQFQKRPTLPNVECVHIFNGFHSSMKSKEANE